jgi:hypothetical protein
MKKEIFAKLRYRFFDGEPTEEEKKAAEAAKNSGEKKFTQAELDAVLNKRFAKEKSEKEKLIADLQKVQENANLTQQEKDALQQQIDGLQETIQTKDQTAQQQIKNIETKYQKELGQTKAEADAWKNRFITTGIHRALTDAAVSSNAHDPQQLVLMFSGLTRLDEEKDEAGKPTGNFIPKMKFQGIDPETKKPVTLDLPVSEAVAHMRENGLHKNLFNHAASGGTGSDAGGASKGQPDASKMPDRKAFADEGSFFKAYSTWRENYNVDGTPIAKK